MNYSVYFNKPVILFISSIFITLCFTGLIYPARYNLLNANAIFEATLFILAILNLKNINKKILPLMFISLCYIIFTFNKAIFLKNINIFDYLLAYKAFIYIIILSFFVNKKIFSDKFILFIFRLLSIFFLIKYSYMNIFSIDNRPGIFTENNFELMLLLILFYLKFIINNKSSIIDITTVFLIFILSGSRSGIVAFAFVLFMMQKFKLNKKMLIKIVLFSFLFVVLVFVFLQRSGGDFNIAEIDRFKFLLNFLSDISDWNFQNYLIGTSVLTPMSEQTCNNLNFYKSLFSYENNGICYSVILHSYILRAVYDHGIFGLLFICYFYYKASKLSGYSLLNSIVFLGIVLLNSLSVSAFNSIYVIFGYIFVLARGDKYVKFNKK